MERRKVLGGNANGAEGGFHFAEDHGIADRRALEPSTNQGDQDSSSELLEEEGRLRLSQPHASWQGER